MTPLTAWFRVRRLPDGTFETQGTPSALHGRQIPSVRHDRPDGVWAWWHWDGSTLRVQTDRFGFFTLFYTVEDGAIAVSASLRTLIEHGARRDIDPLGMGVFLYTGYFINETTPFAAIRVAPPNGGLAWDGALTVHDGTPILPVNDLGYDEAVDAYIDLFRAALRRRLPEGDDFAIPISGGRDSRHILLEAMALGRPPRFAVTTAGKVPARGLEVAPAANLCRVIGVKHVVLEPTDEFETIYRGAVEQSFCADENGWMVGMADYLRRTVRCSYDGVAGDMFGPARVFNRSWLEKVRAGQVEELVETTVMEREITPLVALLGPAYEGAGNRSAVAEAIAGELGRYAQTANPGAMYTTFNRTRREIAMGPYALMHGVEMHCPFMDHELFDTLGGVPYETLWQAAYHDEVIARAYPQYADVPYAEHAAPPPARRAQLHLTRQAVAYALRHHGGFRARAPRLLAHWGRAFTSGAYRRAYRWLSPPRLIYLTMLEQIRQDPMAFANERAGTTGQVQPAPGPAVRRSG